MSGPDQLVGLAGAACVLAGIASALWRSRMRAPAIGTIVDIEEEYEGRQPVVVFTTPENTQVRFVGGWTVGLWGFGLGQTVPVRYLAGDHTKARIATFRGSFVAPLIVVALGAAMLVFGVAGFAADDDGFAPATEAGCLAFEETGDDCPQGRLNASFALMTAGEHLRALAEGDTGRACRFYTDRLRDRTRRMAPASRSCAQTLAALEIRASEKEISRALAHALLRVNDREVVVRFDADDDSALTRAAGAELTLHRLLRSDRWLIDSIKDDGRGGRLRAALST